MTTSPHLSRLPTDAEVEAMAEANPGTVKKRRGGKRAGAGRPLTGAAPRTEKVTVRLSEDERGDMEAKALEGNVKPSEWCRDAVLERLRNQP